jgi:hypothetical protein
MIDPNESTWEVRPFTLRAWLAFAKGDAFLMFQLADFVRRAEAQGKTDEERLRIFKLYAEAQYNSCHEDSELARRWNEFDDGQLRRKANEIAMAISRALNAEVILIERDGEPEAAHSEASFCLGVPGDPDLHGLPEPLPSAMAWGPAHAKEHSSKTETVRKAKRRLAEMGLPVDSVSGFARDVACNALRIAECLPAGALVPGAFPTGLFSGVADAAVTMAMAETLCDWEDAANDWESCCQWCADWLIERIPPTQMADHEPMEVAMLLAYMQGEKAS